MRSSRLGVPLVSGAAVLVQAMPALAQEVRPFGPRANAKRLATLA